MRARANPTPTKQRATDGSALPFRLGTLVTYHTALGVPWPTFDELITRLECLCRRDAIYWLARLSLYVQTWERVSDNKRDKVLRNYVMPDWAQAFNHWTRVYGDGFVFSRYHILWLMRQVFRFCPRKGQRISVWDRGNLQELGELLLMANDLAAFVEPKRLTGSLEVAANTMSALEMASPEHYHAHDLSRTRQIIDIAGRSSMAHLRQFHSKLEHLLGFTIADYFDLTLTSCSIFLTCPIAQDPEAFTPPALAVPLFRETSLDQNSVQVFLNSNSEDERYFRDQARNAPQSNADLTLFRERPLLSLESEFLPLDVAFLLEKAGRSLLWTAIKRSDDPKDREILIQHWGESFEEYVRTLLQECLLHRGTYLRHPEFEDGTQAFDGCILEGKCLIAIETKANTIPSRLRKIEVLARGGLFQMAFPRDLAARKMGRVGVYEP